MNEKQIRKMPEISGLVAAALVAAVSLAVLLFSSLSGDIWHLVKSDSLTRIAYVLLVASMAVSAVNAVRILLKKKEEDETLRLTNMGTVVSDTLTPQADEKIITLFDNEGNMKLSLRQRSIWLFESDDNYIKVWYEDHAGAMRQYMLRCRLKTVEDSFSGSELVRCHRKYIINISKVQVLRKDKDGYVMELDASGLPEIPVSRTYEQNVLSRFNSR